VAIIECYSDRFQPCKEISPYLRSQCEKQKVPLIKVNVNTCTQFVKYFKVFALPTYFVFKKNGTEPAASECGADEQIVNHLILKARDIYRSKK
jgi:thioredoxin-like negative regulator of GroEL